VQAWFDLTQSAHFPALLAVFSGAPLRIGFTSGNRMKKNKNRIYTHAIDFNDRKHIADCYFDLLSPLGLPRPAPLSLKSPALSKDDKDRIDSFLALSGCGDRPLVGIHATGPIKAKRWPLSGWRQVCNHLIGRGYRIIAVGGESETALVEILRAGIGRKSSGLVNAAGILTLPQVFALMPRLRFFIANDGGPMHIAAAFGVPTLGLFGAELPRRYAPINEFSLALYRGDRFPCSPCCKPYAGSWPVCARPLCLEAITPLEVIEAVNLIENTCRDSRRGGEFA
jgi:heptosyltransferase II